jgi:hypothetical protein
MKMRTTALITVICVFTAVPASADLPTVNIDFQGSGVLYTGIGMASDSGTYWNPVGTADVFDLKASDGTTVTDIDVTSTYVSTYGNPGNDLLRDRLIWSEAGNHPGSFDTPTINIAGLDAGLEYNIYIYAGYYGQTYRINGVDKDLTGADWNDNQPSWVEGTQYVSFLGLSPAGGSIDIDVYNIGTTSNPSYPQANTVVSGMQIQAVSASPGPTPIPVPGAFVLGAIGLGMVGWMKRRKDKVEA